jgi:Insertion element 4 transposase N-terminal
MGAGAPRAVPRLADQVALVVLTRTFPPELVDEVVVATGRAEQRHRLLPARLVVYYVLGLALFSGMGSVEVLRCLVEGYASRRGGAIRVSGGGAGTCRPNPHSSRRAPGWDPSRCGCCSSGRPSAGQPGHPWGVLSWLAGDEPGRDLSGCG